MLAVAGAAALALAPLLFLRPPGPSHRMEAGMLAPLRFAYRRSSLLGRLAAPVLITAFAAGLFVPFMNVFFRNRHQASDATIGSLFAAGSLVMALGFLAAPPLAARFGKIRLVLLTQILFIPTLALLGFAPWFWLSVGAYLLRVTLMTMDDPIYQTFVMEQVEETARATVSSLLAIAAGLGSAAGPLLSGWLQVSAGFTPAFLIVIAAYLLAILLTWRFFLTPGAPAAPAVPAQWGGPGDRLVDARSASGDQALLPSAPSRPGGPPAPGGQAGPRPVIPANARLRAGRLWQDHARGDRPGGNRRITWRRLAVAG